MNPENLPAKDFDYLYKKTSSALSELQLAAMEKVANETTLEFAMYCMREVCIKMVATLMSQTIAPKESLKEFNQEVSRMIDLIDLIDLPKENMQ